MKEDFLHYLWKYKKFTNSDLKSVSGEDIIIVNSGQYTQFSGPDFFNAQLVIGKQKWAGNIEIHIKSSDWYVHHHEKDKAYENVILHVVWEHDTDVFNKANHPIPVLELKNYVSKDIYENYQFLVAPKSWIFCEKQITTLDEFIITNWQERLFFERLERKSKSISELVKISNQDWESVLFILLFKNFGLNINGEVFFKAATSIPFSIVKKERFEVENIEALLYGSLGLLDVDKEDNYFKDLKFRFYYLMHKYQFEKKEIESVQFFKHRPDNFPTIRLSQLANVYHQHQNLFSKVINVSTVSEFYKLFTVSTSNYWQTHYLFDKVSPKKNKTLSKSFINLLIINTIVPLQFAYAKSQNKEIIESLITLLQEVAPESNSIVQKFASLGINSKNAFETQSLLQLKNEYCNHSKCLDCTIGTELLKNN